VLDNYADIWEAIADHFGDREAILYGDSVRTWSEFDQRSSRLASAFARLGVEAGSTVAVNLRNCTENVEAIYAAFKLRARPFNVNYRYRERELTYLLNDAKPAVILFDEPLADRVMASIAATDSPVRAIEVHGDVSATRGTFGYEALIAEHESAPRVLRDAEDEYIIYTGGTTGYPKGVVWAHNAASNLPRRGGVLPSSVEELAEAIEELGPPRTQLVIPPLMHASGFLTTVNNLSGARRIVFSTSASLNPAEILSLVERHEVRAFTVIGDAVARPLLEELDQARDAGHPYDLSSVETISNTGGIWSATVKRGFFRHGSFTIADGLNATEGAGFAVSETRDPDNVETAKFHLGPNARVITEDGKDVVPGSGEIGMLATAGRLPKGYLNDPEKTAQTWPTIDGVRYAVPGDLASIDADGIVTLLGRNSEVINTGGEKVFVEEVEVAIMTHPAVQDTLVVGLPDARWGSRVAAVVSLRVGMAVTEREIIDHVGTQIADHKRPSQIVFVKEVPRNPTGKTDRPSAQGPALP
jgi:3-oxocholest-4-en-26-oate---CoA ligase